MNSLQLHRVTRFPRTLDSAFRTPRYAIAIEVAYLPLWRRVLRALWRLA